MSARALPLTSDALPGLLDTREEQMRAWLAERGQPAMRAKQIRRWLFVGRAVSFDGMTDLPLSLRRDLQGAFSVFSTRVSRRLTSIDGTEKLLVDPPPFILLSRGYARAFSAKMDVDKDFAKTSEVSNLQVP